MFYDSWKAGKDKRQITTIAVVPEARASDIVPEYRKLSAAVNFQNDSQVMASAKEHADAAKKATSAGYSPWSGLGSAGFACFIVMTLNNFIAKRKKKAGE